MPSARLPHLRFPERQRSLWRVPNRRRAARYLVWTGALPPPSYCMKNSRWWIVLAFSIAACGQPATFTEAQRAAVADTVRLEADRVIAALASRSVDSLAALFTSDADFVYVDNGRIYPDNAALKAAATPFFGRLGRAGGRWDPAHVLVLAPDAAAFTGVFRAEMADTAGVPLWTDGKIWTFVYQRRAGRWQIVQAHEVNARP